MKQINALMRSAALALLPALALAQPGQAADWPRGDVDLIIPSSPGGGFDTYGRILAKVMGEQLGVTVVPKNISGGGGMRGAQAAFHARPDGQTIGLYNVPGIIEPIVTGQDVGYDIAAIDWIGAMAFNQYIVVVQKDSPYSTLADLKAAGKTITFTGYGASGVAANRILCGEVELECQVITGYPGNNDALLGVVRGDAIASVTPIETAASFNTGGDLKAILLMSDRDVAAFPEVQKATDAGYPTLGSLGLIRAFGLPPKVRPEVAEAVTAAFAAAVGSPEMAQWSDDSNSPLDPMDGAELAGLIDEQTALLEKYRDVIGQAD
ncbi:tripartite tricarboxylate transporter substrate-binding protein (plasmid) [Salipiger sp. H15]|uniref:Tripartite tricarboxylate transporter substrate-binding protein n=1 Tax=Alloyangia sp. H15 TaxID=3029062 RepID=A0AAU8ATB1_9RHOB